MKKIGILFLSIASIISSTVTHAGILDLPSLKITLMDEFKDLHNNSTVAGQEYIKSYIDSLPEAKKSKTIEIITANYDGIQSGLQDSIGQLNKVCNWKGAVTTLVLDFSSGCNGLGIAYNIKVDNLGSSPNCADSYDMEQVNSDGKYTEECVNSNGFFTATTVEDFYFFMSKNIISHVHN